ncbi:DUF423 domain-containing protein [Lutibacter citreus]|uniref:DUF423 domain-containing protein n=1 Tax=Lutibacter citreus TaxID=2138210 RepID=UPI000DBE1A14|nr:DUF423 domain-containing protein [Lutibacter citreus]
MKKILVLVAFLGAITVILGAFGAHSLKDILNVQELKSFDTAVRYQMYHVLVLLFVNSYNVFTIKQKKNISMLFLFGILFFSGSIYAIVFGIEAKNIWFVTPLGGFLFILGWVLLAFSFFNEKTINKGV